MRERLFIFLSVGLILVALVGLNAASYAPVEELPDSEERANRSTYNPGATGLRAFYDFLRETGRPVVRWQEKPFALRNQTGANKPRTFIILGNAKRNFEDDEIKDLLTWVADGNRLVLIDREPPAALLPQSGNWKFEVKKSLAMFEMGDSSNVNEMTLGVAAAKPAQPAVLTARVNSVMSSKFATGIKFNSAVTDAQEVLDDDETFSFPELTPVVHLTTKDKNILVDVGYGAGNIVVLSDPYIVSNAGIGLVDNLMLASNLAGYDGLIAFDEYHQGYGASGNSLYNFFAGTPIPALFAQFGLLVLLVVYTRGRRFGRPLPLANPDRRSKLEYVGAMAELQRSTRAYDLAIENIYGRVRRELSRFAGVDNTATPAPVLAERVAERSSVNRLALQHLLTDCENAVHGATVSPKEALNLVARLRELEQQLGFQKKDAKKIKE